MKKILLVDDEPHVIHVLKLFLKKNGYEVITANNGEQALKKVISDNPDVVITDIQMPRMSGQDLCDRLQKELPDPDRRIIVMTSRTDNDLRIWAKNFNKLEFLEKPLSPRRLVARLRSYFNTVPESTELTSS